MATLTDTASAACKVRANRPAAASAASLARDDAPCAADQADGPVRWSELFGVTAARLRNSNSLLERPLLCGLGCPLDVLRVGRDCDHRQEAEQHDHAEDAERRKLDPRGIRRRWCPYAFAPGLPALKSQIRPTRGMSTRRDILPEARPSTPTT